MTMLLIEVLFWGAIALTLSIAAFILAILYTFRNR